MRAPFRGTRQGGSPPAGHPGHTDTHRHRHTHTPPRHTKHSPFSVQTADTQAVASGDPGDTRPGSRRSTGSHGQPPARAAGSILTVSGGGGTGHGGHGNGFLQLHRRGIWGNSENAAVKFITQYPCACTQPGANYKQIILNHALGCGGGEGGYRGKSGRNGDLGSPGARGNRPVRCEPVFSRLFPGRGPVCPAPVVRFPMKPCMSINKSPYLVTAPADNWRKEPEGQDGMRPVQPAMWGDIRVLERQAIRSCDSGGEGPGMGRIYFGRGRARRDTTW